ncbi:sulfotransferase [Maricaulis sp.]|uniref:sulfotransferase family protein n=1 Tax=Maricaulis sp. TaxID=1486257 RepID=UPI002B26E447|nr:sulfotransferase [Maricaulis sp.]
MSVLGIISETCQVVMPRLWPLTALDRQLAKSVGDGPALPPIFIVGPPRTGTTILYQRLLTHFRFTYPSNVDAALFSLPCMAHAISRSFKDRERSHGDSSDFGYVPGLWGASEAGPLMRYFLDDERRVTSFGQAVRHMSAASGLPYLCKNTVNAVRLPTIFEALPDAWVVRTHRDRETTARSILKMRRSVGSEQDWAGVRPDGSESVSAAAPIEQTRWQYDAVQSQIDRDLAAAGRTAFDVQYEEFIADPPAMLQGLASAYANDTGIVVGQSGIPIPDMMKKPG